MFFNTEGIEKRILPLANRPIGKTNGSETVAKLGYYPSCEAIGDDFDTFFNSLGSRV